MAHEEITGVRQAGNPEWREARKQAEWLLAESEARFRALTELSGDLVQVVGAGGTIRYASASHLPMLGYTPESMLGRSSLDYLHPEDARQARQALEQVARGEGARTLTVRACHAAGDVRTLEMIVSSRLDDPAVRGLVVNARDVTARMRAEAALLQSEARFRTLVEASPVGACLTDEHRRFELVNDAYCALFGYSREELVGADAGLLLPLLRHPEASPVDARLAERALQGQAEYEMTRKDGTPITVLASAAMVMGADGRPRRASFLIDITERVRAERAVQEARMLAEAMDRVSIALATTLEPDQLYRIILEQATAVLPCDNAVIFLHRDGWAWAVASRGVPAVPPGTRLFPVTGPGRPWVATDYRDLVYLPDADVEPSWIHLPPWAGEQRARSVIAVPLRIDGDVVGSFQLHSSTPRRYDQRHVALADAFGARIVQALRNARRYAEEQHRADRLAALQAVMAALATVRTTAAVAQVIVERGGAAVGAAASSLRLLTADGTALDLVAAAGYAGADYEARARLPVSAGHPLAEAALTSRPLWCHSQAEFQAHFADASSSWHAATDLQGAATLPLIVDERIIGVLALSFATPQLFSQVDRDFLLTLADAAAQALERARLFVAEQERARAAEELARLRAAQVAQAEAMATISTALGGTLEPEQLYVLILEQAVRLLPSDQAVVLLYEDGWATVAATWGSPAQPVGTRVYPVAGPDTVWQATDYPGAIYLADTTTTPAWVDIPPYVGEHRIRSLLAAPLFIDGVAVGSLNLHAGVPGYYGEQQLPLATAFAERVCQALRNARLYRAEWERRRAAEELAQLRNDFLGAVSHELRTPLTSVIGYAELLRERGHLLDEAHQADYLDRIILAANRQQRLVQDLLQTSRIEAGVLRCDRVPFVLRPVLERAVSEVQAGYRGQRVELHGPDELAVEADAGRTQQILINLIDNAAKYSPEGSPVAVSWTPLAGRAAVRVRDRGTGIPEAGQAQLFTRFGRLPGSRTRAGRTGTGLGLYLSRLVARAMDGELELEASGPEGSTFLLRLPLAFAGEPGAR